MKIAIVGTAPLSFHAVPFDDPEWKIWVCSPGNAHGRCKRVDAWFELHAIEEMMSPRMRAMSSGYFGWLRTQAFPVYMQERNEYVPGAIVYPFQLMLDRFGRNWFSSSIAFMMAYAIHLGAKEIGIFGVDMAAPSEAYSAQKAGCIRFIEIAKERGITVTIPLDSCLGKQPPIYGYNEASHMGKRFAAMRQELEEKKAAIAQQVEALKLEHAYMSGALEQIGYTERTWIDGADAILDLDPVALPAPSVNHRVDDFKKSEGGVYIPKAGLNGSGAEA